MTALLIILGIAAYTAVAGCVFSYVAVKEDIALGGWEHPLPFFAAVGWPIYMFCFCFAVLPGKYVRRTMESKIERARLLESQLKDLEDEL